MRLFKDTLEELQEIDALILEQMRKPFGEGGFGTQASEYTSNKIQIGDKWCMQIEENDVRIWQCMPQNLKAQMVPDNWDNPILSPEQVAELEASKRNA